MTKEHAGTTLKSSDSKFTYLMGIIDTCTDYGAFKKTEALLKGTFFGPGVSCRPPKEYAQRFCKFLASQLE